MRTACRPCRPTSLHLHDLDTVEFGDGLLLPKRSGEKRRVACCAQDLDWVGLDDLPAILLHAPALHRQPPDIVAPTLGNGQPGALFLKIPQDLRKVIAAHIARN